MGMALDGGKIGPRTRDEWFDYLHDRQRAGGGPPLRSRLAQFEGGICRDTARRLIARIPERHVVLRNELEGWARQEWGA